MTNLRVLAPVEFHGQELTVVGQENEPYVAMKPVVEGMGLAWSAQYVKLCDNSERWGVTKIVMASTSGSQEMVCIPLRKLFGWLMSVHPNKVSPVLREKIVLYQAECDEVLWRHWMQRDGAQLKTPAQLILESAHVLVDHENRLQVIEEAVKRIEARSEEARNVIARLPAAPHPAPEMTYRALTNQLVRTTCVERNIEFSDGWNWLYNEFYYRERIDLKQRHAHAVKSGLIPARTRILEYAQMLEDKKEIMNCTGRLYSVARAIFIEKDFRVVRNG